MTQKKTTNLPESWVMQNYNFSNQYHEQSSSVAYLLLFISYSVSFVFYQSTVVLVTSWIPKENYQQPLLILLPLCWDRQFCTRKRIEEDNEIGGVLQQIVSAVKKIWRGRRFKQYSTIIRVKLESPTREGYLFTELVKVI